MIGLPTEVMYVWEALSKRPSSAPIWHNRNWPRSCRGSAVLQYVRSFAAGPTGEIVRMERPSKQVQHHRTQLVFRTEDHVAIWIASGLMCLSSKAYLPTFFVLPIQNSHSAAAKI